jgi:hypothetical protein
MKTAEQSIAFWKSHLEWIRKKLIKAGGKDKSLEYEIEYAERKIQECERNIKR